MNTANLSCGILIFIKKDDIYKYNFYYTAENYYMCCEIKSCGVFTKA